MNNSLLIALFVSLFAVGGLQSQEEKVTVKGSDTMVILGQRWAEEYMKKNSGQVIQVTGGGSGTGIAALLNGTTDICNSSRPIKDTERAKLKEKFGSSGVEIKCAIDGLSVFVNATNKVQELSVSQIKDIFTGKIKNWKELGGSDSRIILYSRENNSGTYVYFKEEVLKGEDFAANAQNMPGTAALVNAIAKDKQGIGFGGMAYGKGIVEVKIRKDDSSAAFAPTVKNIKSGEYPLGRYLYMYVRSKPTGVSKKYIDWILSPEGQSIVSNVGFVPIR